MSVSNFETVSVTGTAGGLTAATYAGAVKATITVEACAIRYRGDGTAPTATSGHVLNPGDVLKLDTPDEIRRAKFISRDGGTASIVITYEV